MLAMAPDLSSALAYSGLVTMLLRQRVEEARTSSEPACRFSTCEEREGAVGGG